jgi:hypothetical protein
LKLIRLGISPSLDSVSYGVQIVGTDAIDQRQLARPLREPDAVRTNRRGCGQQRAYTQCNG